MAVVTELDSFIIKFRQLWKSGHDARLQVETKAGKADVALHLQLGSEPSLDLGHCQSQWSKILLMQWDIEFHIFISSLANSSCLPYSGAGNRKLQVVASGFY